MIEHDGTATGGAGVAGHGQAGRVRLTFGASRLVVLSEADELHVTWAGGVEAT